MEDKKFLALIGIVVGIFWGVNILKGWNAYDELNSLSLYSGELRHLFEIQEKKMLTSLFLQSAAVVAILYFSFKNLKVSLQKSAFDSDDKADLSSDAYKIYLTKKYKIEKNLALDKIICEDKMFETIDDALVHASNIDKQSKVKKTENGSFDFTK